MSTCCWILLVLPIIVVYLAGSFLSRCYGFWGWIFGIIAGSFLFGLIQLVLYYGNKKYPIHPSCRNGKCTSEDYNLVEYDEQRGIFIFCCKCGTKYLQDHSYFKEILPDGSIKAYMKRGRCGHWQDDS